MEIKLRVILLGVGLLILLVVAFDFFRRKQVNDGYVEEDNKYPRPRISSLPLTEEYAEPELDIYQNQAAAALQETAFVVEIEPAREDIVISTVVENHNIITISIMSRDQYGFPGADLLSACAGAHLKFGKNDIFHREEDEEVLFSLANAVEPGYFILETLADEHVPGIILIFLPEEASDPQKTFDKLIRAAKQIAFALNGELLDHTRKPLTLETIEQYRKQAEATSKRQ